MNRDWAIRWYKRLKKTRRKQGTGKLRSEYNEYCCLGVLCEMLIEDGLLVKEKHFVTDWDGSSSFEGYKYKPVNAPEDANYSDGYLKENILEIVGMNHEDQMHFGTLNDEYGESFKEIADHVKRMYIDTPAS